MNQKINQENLIPVMAKYLIAISGHTGTNWQIKGTALACYSLATLSMLPSTCHAFELGTNIIQPWFSILNMLIGSPMVLGL
jgi:uncharacterized membrane protein